MGFNINEHVSKGQFGRSTIKKIATTNDLHIFLIK